MEGIDHNSTVEEICATISEVEKSAGIFEEMERIREGPLIPLGALGEDVTPDEYFADQHDYIRRNTRKTYFSVSDEDIRRELIEACREFEKAIDRNSDIELRDAQNVVQKIKSQEFNEPHISAALASMLTVFIGNVQFGIPGAIGGAMGGYFIGHWILTQRKKTWSQSLRDAVSAYEDAKRTRDTNRLFPEYFSLDEEISGVADKEEHSKSAAANLYQRSQTGISL